MGLLSKWFGIDARRNAQNQAEQQRKATEQAAADAQALQETVAAQQKQYQDAMLNMQQENSSLTATNQELATDTISNVVSGGTADASAASDLKRKKGGAGIAASLGINV